MPFYLAGIALGLLLGLLLGGRLDNLLSVRLRWPGVIFLALLLRVGTEVAISRGIGLAEALRLPLFVFAFGLLVWVLWRNRELPGLLIAANGVAANTIAIAANGGWMPVWRPSLELAGFSPDDLSESFHQILPETLGGEFLLRAGPFGDIIPIPLPLIANVASIGDIFLLAGLGWFVFSTLLRAPESAAAREPGPTATAPYFDARPLDQPILLGSVAGVTSPVGLVAPAMTTAAERGLAAAPVEEERPRPTALGRIRGHAYVRLALDARFSSFWLAQTISLFGDRLHQVALAVLVYTMTGSPLLTGLVFLAATLPNLLLGPIAGTFVDRWDHKEVLVVSDLLRAALVLVLPAVALMHISLVYPVVFAITAISLFFRPAKAAVVPRLVDSDDLMAANSATWTGETLADIAGYPLAGLFVAFLGPALPLAFWLDAASYVVSALLVLGLAIPPVAREAGPAVGSAARRFLAELREGWRFLSDQPQLFQNTLISAVAQMSIGATLALTVVYARDWLDGGLIGYPANYAAIEMAIGLGNLVGGLAVGALGARLRKGWLIVAGFLVMGISTVFLGLTQNVLLALLTAAVIGVANLVFIIPTQTLFAEVTPMPMMGRVVAFRSSLVFGAMTAAMAVSGILAERFEVGIVIALFGCVTTGAGLAAVFLPAVRDS